MMITTVSNPILVDFHHDPVKMAHRLLGQRLVHVTGDDSHERLAGTIVEVEAYLGVEDRAAHTFGGRRTSRNESMYLPGGHAYVYMIYGIHHCLNIVCGERDEGVAVLVRAIEPTEGIERMRTNRANGGAGSPLRDADLCSGPGKLTRAMGIDRTLDGHDLRRGERLFIERGRRRRVSDRDIIARPRVGVDYAGEWAKTPLRFLLRGNAHVSRP